MSIIQNLNDVSKQLFSKNNDNLLFHKHRSGRLLKRVVLVVRAIKVSENTKDPKILQVADLLATTLEEIRDYMTLFSTKNTVLAKHVVIYGSDEEQFIKWGERLQHCVDTFGESASFIGVFDEEIDVQDFQKDLVFLKSRMNEILALLVEDAESKGSNVSPVDLIKTMESLIGHQANVRSTYKTKTAPTEALEIDPKKIKYEKIIGQGGFGVVWSARYKGENVAIKTIPSQTLTKQSVADLKSEANIMRRLAHPRIVSCFGMFEHEGNQCVVMELMESGSLQDYIHEHQCPEGWLMREAIALDICSGMSYLHRLNVIHRDLKPGNVVLNGYLQAKITDFGLSVVKNTAVTSIKGSEMGTVQYMAPECFGLSPQFSSKSDVFSFAIILWELAHWKFAYKNVRANEIKDAIRINDRLEIDEGVPILLTEMIKSCWGGNHRQRPEFATLAKQLEADVIVLKLSSPVVFQVAKYANLPEKLPNFQVDSNTVSLNILEKAKALSASKDTSPTVNAVNQPTTDLKNLKKAPKKFEAHKPAKSIIFKFRAMTKAKKLLLVVAIFVVLAAISGIILAVTVSGNKGVSTLNQIFTLSTTSATSTTLSITGFTTSFSTPIPGPTPTHYCQTNYTNPVVSTFAGNGISVEDDTPLLSASFTDPLGIAITPENDFIVTENGSRKRILKIISKNNTVSRMIINHPLSLNYDFVPVAGSETDTGNCDGRVGVSLLQSSVGLLINGSDVIVFDLYNRYVKVLDDVNIIRTVLTLTPGAPVSGAFDSQKNLFFTDLRNNAIWRLTPNRIPSNFIGNSTLLPSPAGIIIDPCQNLLVISNHAGTGEVTLFSPSGVARILAGKRNGTAKYIDGSGFIARFSRIENLVQDRMGNIYIPDKDNHVIRKISFT